MLQFIEFLGIITFALSGIVEARRKRMDLIGVYTVALLAKLARNAIAAVVLLRLAALRLGLRLPGVD